jgi:hypothetical protein
MGTPHLLMINETRRNGGRHVAEKYRVTEQCHDTPSNCLQLATASLAPVNPNLICSVLTAAASVTPLMLNQRNVS